MIPNSDPRTAVDGPRVLCARCCRTYHLSAAELARYTHGGWPKCCGQVMTYLAGTDPTTVKETAVDLPCFP